MNHSSLQHDCYASQQQRSAAIGVGKRRRTKDREGNEGLVSHKRLVSKEMANLGTSELQ